MKKLFLVLLFIIFASMAHATCRSCIASTVGQACGACVCTAWAPHARGGCGAGPTVGANEVTEERRTCSNPCGSRVERRTRTCRWSCGACPCGAATCQQTNAQIGCVRERRTCGPNHPRCNTAARTEERTRTVSNPTWSAWNRISDDYNTRCTDNATLTAAATRCGECVVGPITCFRPAGATMANCLEQRRTTQGHALCTEHVLVERRTRGWTGDPWPLTWTRVSGQCTSNVNPTCTCTAWGAISTVSGSCSTAGTFQVTNPAIAAGNCTAAGHTLHATCPTGQTQIVGCDRGANFACGPTWDNFFCIAGFWRNGTACTACPANATCAGSNANAFSCNAGWFRNGTATTCTICPAGAHSAAGATSCPACANNQFSAAGSASCTACALMTGAGSATWAGGPFANQAACDTGHTATTCITGFWLNGGVCETCPANATCAGTNANRFVCNAGFVEEGNGCVLCDGLVSSAGTCCTCPTNATCTPGSSTATITTPRGEGTISCSSC